MVNLILHETQLISKLYLKVTINVIRNKCVPK